MVTFSPLLATPGPWKNGKSWEISLWLLWFSRWFDQIIKLRRWIVTWCCEAPSIVLLHSFQEIESRSGKDMHFCFQWNPIVVTVANPLRLLVECTSHAVHRTCLHPHFMDFVQFYVPLFCSISMSSMHKNWIQHDPGIQPKKNYPSCGSHPRRDRRWRRLRRW